MSGLSARHMTAGLDEVRETGGWIKGARFVRVTGFGLSCFGISSRGFIVCFAPRFCRPLPVSSYGRSGSLSGNLVRPCFHWVAVYSTSGQQSPDHPRRLVGQRNCHDLERASAEQVLQPRPRLIVSSHMAKDGCSSCHKQRAQLRIAHLRDAPQTLLAAARVLARCEADPC